MEGLLNLVSSRVRPNEVAMFFWMQLQHDIGDVSKTTGKSQDEVCLLLHMILKEVATKDPPHSKCEMYYVYNFDNIIDPGMSTFATLSAKTARAQWELHFTEVYLQPFLSV